MTVVNDGLLKMNNALEFLDLFLQMGMVQAFAINMSMDRLIVFGKLAIVANDCLFNAIGYDLKLHIIPFILTTNLDNLQMKGPPLPLGIIHLQESISVRSNTHTISSSPCVPKS